MVTMCYQFSIVITSIHHVHTKAKSRSHILDVQSRNLWPAASGIVMALRWEVATSRMSTTVKFMPGIMGVSRRSNILGICDGETHTRNWSRLWDIQPWLVYFWGYLTANCDILARCHFVLMCIMTPYSYTFTPIIEVMFPRRVSTQ